MANFLKGPVSILEAISRLRKATDTPVGQPGSAREEAPVGWDFGSDGELQAKQPVDQGTGGPAQGASAPLADLSAGKEQTGDAVRGAGGNRSGDDIGATGTTGADAAIATGRSHPGEAGRHDGAPSGQADGQAKSVGNGGVAAGQQPSPGGFVPGSAPGGGGAGEAWEGGGEDGQPQAPSPPMIGGVDVGAVTEDATLSASGLLVALSPNGGGMTWSMVGDNAGHYGELDFDLSTGQWAYRLDNAAAQGLRAGETVQEVFTLRATDQTGASVDHQITITVEGTNDAPSVVRTMTAPMVTEDVEQTTSGYLHVMDTDIGDTATWSIIGSDVGRYGNLVLGDDGRWSYSLDNDAAQGLKAGDIVQDSFMVQVTDSAGASVTQTVSVMINGTNDVPVISGTASGIVEEDSSLAASGRLSVADADIGDTATWSVVGDPAGRYGSLVLGEDGRWTYSLDNDAAQGLKAGDTVQEIFTVQVTDSAGAPATQTVVVTVSGTNDVPVISGTATGIVEEDSSLAASGRLSVADADIGDTATWSVVGPGIGSYGSLVLGSDDGRWTYTLDNDAAQGLKAGDTVQEIFTVQATDSAGASVTQTVVITVAGANDAPTISGTAAGTVVEDGVASAGGMLTVSDPDIGDSVSWSIVGSDSGGYGMLTLGDDGRWTYSLDNAAAQGLKEGETAQEIFTLRVTDDSGATAERQVVVTVTGANDAPAISGTYSGAVTEDGALTASGQLAAVDADRGDDASWSVAGSGSGIYGGLTLGQDGSWTYSLDNDAVQGLKAGETVQDIFTIRVTDAAGAAAEQVVAVTIRGTNDAPVISGIMTGRVEDGDVPIATGQLAVSDPDIGDTAIWSLVGGGTGGYGSLVLDDDGRWTYSLDHDAAQGLKAGETVQEIFTVTATDSTGASTAQIVTITVVGTNDDPTISGTATGLVQEDATLTAAGQLTGSDPDSGDIMSWSVVGSDAGNYGSLALGQDGSWSYALDNDAAQGLKAGDSAQDIFVVRLTDAAGAVADQVVTITIHGTNDNPVIAGTATGIVEEDGAQSVSGQLTAADPDIGDTAAWSVAGSGAGHYGTFMLEGDGSWSYSLDNAAAQGLKAGQSVQEIFTVRVSDGAGGAAEQVVAITVAGTNDTPVISGAATGAVAEDGILTASGRLEVADVDIGDTATWSLAGSDTGRYGVLGLDQSTGQWTYTLDNEAAQGLKAGETAQEIFTLRVTDEAGASADQQVTVTVTGTNDDPVISGTATGAVSEDGILTASGQFSAADADLGDTASWTVVGTAAGAYGVLTVDPDSGAWVYTLDNAAAQGLRSGETAQDVFAIRVTDDSGATAEQTITVAVAGTNDAPVISGAAAGIVLEDGIAAVGGVLAVADADIGDTAAWSVVGPGTGSYGNLALGDDGRWTYMLDNDAAQGLKAGETAQDIFMVQVTDSAGAHAGQIVTVTVVGTNDAPVIAGTATGAVQEDGALAASGQLSVTDADIGDTASWSIVGPATGSYGMLTLDDGGRWSYVLDNDAAQGLKEGEVAQEIFTVRVSDGAGGMADQTVSVSVTGTNDVPVISGTMTGAVAEDGVLMASGQLSAADTDSGDTTSWSVVGDGAGTYGRLVVDADGGWSYVLDNDAAQGLKAGETVQEIFTLRVSDAAGAAVDQQITVTVAGTDDTPVISGTTTGAVSEDGVLTASGQLSAIDADVGDTVAWSLADGNAGAYGVLTVDAASGIWSYVLDNDAAQGLRAGETVQDSFTLQASDGAGGVAQQVVTLTIVGTNDAPVIAGTATGAVEEDGTLTTGGRLTATDADIGDHVAWSIEGAPAAAYGDFAIDPATGQWTYILDNVTAQSLGEGEIVRESFTARATDASGAYADRLVTVEITGRGDGPVADAPSLTVTVGPGTVIEGGSGGGGIGSGGDTSLGLNISVAEPPSYEMTGTDGADLINGGAGNDSILGGAGDDNLRGDLDYVTGEYGDDIINAGAGNDLVIGGDGSDRIIGGDGNDRIMGDFEWQETPNAGNDVIDAGAGDDTVIGGRGDDDIAGGAGNDYIVGDFGWETDGGNDRIDAGAGDDTAWGGAGDDIIAGGEGNDTLYGDYAWTTGRDGNDILAGGKGNDTIDGGGGIDAAVYAGLRSQYQVVQNPDGSFTITDLVGDRDGTDKVSNVEIFRFADGDVAAGDLMSGIGGGAPVGDVIEYPLDITAALTDTDGSEALSDISISMAGVPDGTTFSAGSLVDGNWVLSPAQLDGLTMTVPAGAPAFGLEVSVTSTESENGDSRTTTVSVGVDEAGPVTAAGDDPADVAHVAAFAAPANDTDAGGDVLAAAMTGDTSSVHEAEPAGQGFAAMALRMFAATPAADDAAGHADLSHAAGGTDTDGSPGASDGEPHQSGMEPLSDTLPVGLDDGEVHDAGPVHVLLPEADPVQPYHDLIAQFRSGGDQAGSLPDDTDSPDGGWSGATPETASMDMAALASAGPSAANEYMAYADVQAGGEAHVGMQGAAAEDAGYTQVMGLAADQDPWSPDHVAVDASLDPATGVMPAPDVAQHADAAALPVSEPPVSHDQDNAGM